MGWPDLRDLTRLELARQLVDAGEKSYAASQIFGWLYRRNISDISRMSDQGIRLRHYLSRHYTLQLPLVAGHLISRDKTEKFLLRLSDGNHIETVLIPSGERRTLCLSTQVGCKYCCAFCASGQHGFARNLKPSEILGQILVVRSCRGTCPTHYVFMGMGEPLDNYAFVVKALQIMNDPQGLGIGARRITISTCGIIPGIEKLKNLGLQINLSISLHAANQGLRLELVPAARRYPLDKLLDACRGYIKQTGRILTLEYVLLAGRNDSCADAKGLAAIAKTLKAKINLIPYSPVEGLGFQTPSGHSVRNFIAWLKKDGAAVTLRQSKGKDIAAACGQLAGR